MNWRCAFCALSFVAFSLVMCSADAFADPADGSEMASSLTSGVDSVLSFAQSAAEDSTGSTRIRGRGVGKLIGLVIAAIVGIFSFIMKKIRGDS